ncbi:MAG TPA: hypothetical protein VM869_31230 [Enhygromyxa sp.]|nr:hypothetical protein [Enhygromyxa sp.]
MQWVGAIVRASARACLLAGSLACTAGAASEQDCEALGDKFVELYTAELSEDARKLPPEVLERAAAKGRDEIIDQCKAKSTPKATVQRCLGATTMDEFKAC